MLILLLFLLCAVRSATVPTEPATATTVSAEPAPEHYTLTPAERARAEAYSHAQDVAYFAGVTLTLAIYLLFWLSRFGVAVRRLAERASSRLFVKCLILAPLVIGTAMLLGLPLDYYSGYTLEHRFALSAESPASWLGDWSKGLALTLIASVIVVWLLYAALRQSPRRWWFYFWLLTIPLELFVMFIEPWVVEPLFYKFTPLARTEPALTERIETMMGHAGLDIPCSRIFEMNASAKTKTLNAYVSGVGPSTRVVVWDTSIAAFSPDEILTVLGHETGHYVLHHIPKEFAWFELILLGLFYLGYLITRGLVGRFGARTALEGEGDMASLPLMMLVLVALSFVASPVFNGISRHYEHQADQYGLEVSHGVVLDPNASEARAMQKLGALDLADPDPSPLAVFWLYSHPPIEDRIRFARSYHPWIEGRPMELVRPEAR